MNRLTTIDFEAMARECLGGPDKGEITPQRIIGYLNLEQREVAGEYRPQELYSTFQLTVGPSTNIYALPVTDVMRLSDGISDIGYLVREMHGDQYRRRMLVQNSSGPVTSYMRMFPSDGFTPTIAVWPASPDVSTITFHYLKSPPELTYDMTNPQKLALSQFWDALLLDRVVLRCAQGLERFGAKDLLSMAKNLNLREQGVAKTLARSREWFRGKVVSGIGRRRY